MGKTPVMRAKELLSQLSLEEKDFCYYDRQMKYGLHNGDFMVSVGTSCEDIHKIFDLRVRDGEIIKT